MVYLFRVLHHLYHWLLPAYCVLCGQISGRSLNVCLACEQDLPILTQACQQCAAFLFSEQAKICGACLKDPPPFDKTFALFRYESPINHLIIYLKFHAQLHYAQALGELFVQGIQRCYQAETLPDVIMPIPLHKTRLRERGFNQALEIARPIARSLNIPLDFLSVKRVKATEAQSLLAADKRKQNMRNAFASHHSYAGLSIAVIDDVMTTGHTLREFCQLLKKQGAARVDVWCCARRV